MKKITKLIIGLIFLNLNIAIAQYPNWENYVNPEIITDHLETTNEIWFSTKSGVIKMDKTTLQLTTYDKLNANLPSNEVEGIAEDSNGSLWIGTYNQAIAKFDGTIWTTYELPDSLLNTSSMISTYCIEVDNQDVVWVGTSQGLLRFDGLTWQLFNSTQGISLLHDVWALDLDHQGNLVVGSFYIYKYDGTTFHNMTDTTNIPIYGGLLLFHQSNGNLWVSNKFGTIGMFDGLTWTEYQSSAGEIPFEETYTLGESPTGEMYFTSKDSGRYVLQNGIWQPVSITNSLPLENDYLTTCFYDNQGNEWLANGEKLVKNDGQNITNIDLNTNGPKSNSIRNVSSFGNMKYFMTNREILTFDGTTWSEFVYPDSLFGSWYYLREMLFIDTDDIWIATSSKGMLHWNGSIWTHFATTANNLPNDNITDLIWNEVTQTLWCSGLSGLMRYDGTTWTIYNSTNTPMSDDFIRGMAVDNNGVIYVSVSSNAAEFWQFDGTTWQNLAIGTTAPQFTLSHLHIDKNNTIWAGSWYGGVYQYTGFNWLNWNESNSDLPHDNTVGLRSDDDGNIYVGTSHGGAAMFDGTTWHPWTTENSGLTNNRILDLELDDNDKLWFTTIHGISAVQLSTTNTTPITFENNELTVFPNPITDKATIQFTIKIATQSIQLRVYNTNGQTIMNKRIDGNRVGEQQLEIIKNNWTSGLYYLEIRYNNVKMTQPILVR